MDRPMPVSVPMYQTSEFYLPCKASILAADVEKFTCFFHLKMFLAHQLATDRLYNFCLCIQASAYIFHVKFIVIFHLFFRI